MDISSLFFEGGIATKYFYAVLIIIASIICAKVFFYVFKKIVLRITSKTKTTLDETIVESTERPVELAIVLIGVYMAISYSGLFAEYSVIMHQIFYVLAVLIAVDLALRNVNAIAKWYEENKTVTRVQRTLYFSLRNIFDILVYIIAFLVILGIFNVELTPVIASLGIGGLAIALALQTTLSNYFAGLYIAADGSVKMGDYVEISPDVKGYIEHIGWRSTKMRTLSNNLIVIPNAKLAESTVTNYYDPTKEISVVVKCGVAYGSDLEKVEKVTIEAAKKVLKENEGAVKEFEPFVRFNNFGDSNIDFNIILRAKDYVSKFRLTHEFIKELDKAYKKHNIEISWPVRKVFMSK